MTVMQRFIVRSFGVSVIFPLVLLASSADFLSSLIDGENDPLSSRTELASLTTHQKREAGMSTHSLDTDLPPTHHETLGKGIIALNIFPRACREAYRETAFDYIRGPPIAVSTSSV